MMNAKGQRGISVWALLALLAVLAIGAWQWREYQTRQRIAAAEAKAAQEQRERAEAERKEREERVAREKAALKDLDALVARWNDANKVAGATGRIALSGPVSTMQAIKQEADKIEAPACLDSGDVALRKSMDATVQGYLVFMKNELSMGSTLAQPSFEEAAKHMRSYQDSRDGCPA